MVTLMKNAEQPAFPRAGSEHTNLADHITHEPTEGLTKREYFAAMAMQGMVKDIVWQDSVTGEIHSDDYVAKVAVLVADALLKQLEP